MNKEMRKALRLLLPVLSLLPAAAFGQQTIEQAYAEFGTFAKNNGVKYSESRDRQADPATGELIERSHTIHFSAEQGDARNRLIDWMSEAFDRDRDASYSEFSRRGGEQGAQPIVIGREIWVGTDARDCYTVMTFAEKKDGEAPTHRTVYAMEWREEQDGQLTGKLVSSYGPIPDNDRSHARSTASVFGSISPSQLDGLEKYLGMMTRLLDSPSDTLHNSKSIDKWFYKFRILCNAQRKSARQGKTPTMFPSDIYKMCKTGRDMLSDGECELCRKELERLISATKDDFDRDLLEQARRLLER